MPTTKDKSKWWTNNPARAIILADLENGKVPLDENEMSPEEAFHVHYKDNQIVQAVGFNEFQKRLKNHREQVLKKRQNGPTFPWKSSEAKCILLEDLYRGILSLENNAEEPEKKWTSYYKALEKDLNQENEAEKFNAFKERLEKMAMTAEQAWENHYKHLPAFELVKFAQFKNNLKSHRKQAKAGKLRSMEEEKLWREDLKRYPPKSKKANGKPLWDSHPAKQLMRADVAEGKHKKMKPKQLRESKDEYKEFPLKEFGGHVYQENRRRRFCNYLKEEREKKFKIHCHQTPVDMDDDTMAERMKALELGGETEEQQTDVVHVEEEVLEHEEQADHVMNGPEPREGQTNAETCRLSSTRAHGGETGNQQMDMDEEEPMNPRKRHTNAETSCRPCKMQKLD